MMALSGNSPRSDKARIGVGSRGNTLPASPVAVSSPPAIRAFFRLAFGRVGEGKKQGSVRAPECADT